MYATEMIREGMGSCDPQVRILFMNGASSASVHKLPAYKGGFFAGKI